MRKLLLTVSLLLCLAGPEAIRAQSKVITYQGRLTDSGVPANGQYRMRFGVFAGPQPVGGQSLATVTQTVSVVNGLFTATPDFQGISDPNIFDGGDRWLEIGVAGGIGDPNLFTGLVPRQQITFTPYALHATIAAVAQSLESPSNQPVSLKINGQQVLLLGGPDTSPTRPPNLIVGHSENEITLGVVGGVIGGGGAVGEINRVTADFATVNGGFGNQAGAGDPPAVGTGAALMGGPGLPNGSCASPTGVGSTIGGGAGNLAQGDYATVSGGRANRAQASWSSIGGGQTNLAAACWSAISGGFNNWVRTSSPYGTIGGGSQNVIETNTPNATIGGGQGNRVSIDSPYATVAGGRAGLADHYGQFAYAHGSFGGVAGSAQTSIMVPHGISTNTNVIELFLDGPGGSRRMVVRPGATWVFDILVTGRTSAGQSAGYTVRGVIENVSGTMAFVGTPAVTALGEDVGAWNVSVLANDANDALVIRVAGSTGATVRWVANVRTAEVVN